MLKRLYIFFKIDCFKDGGLKGLFVLNGVLGTLTGRLAAIAGGGTNLAIKGVAWEVDCLGCCLRFFPIV